jgi:hypothetical protein
MPGRYRSLHVPPFAGERRRRSSRWTTASASAQLQELLVQSSLKLEAGKQQFAETIRDTDCIRNLIPT